MSLALERPELGPEAMLSKEDRLAARSTYFLLGPGDSDSGTTSVQSFVHETLAPLVRKITCRTELRVREYRGKVRGRVLWPATVKNRVTGEVDPTRFVCRDVRRRFDTPENQLLKFMVEAIHRCIESVPDTLAHGFCCRRGRDGAASETVGETLDHLLCQLNRCARHARLRQVASPKAITPAHLRAAESSKTEEYAIVAALYRRYEQAMRSSALEDMSRGLLVLPGTHDEEATPWIRLAASILRDRASAAGSRARAVSHTRLNPIA